MQEGHQALPCRLQTYLSVAVLPGLLDSLPSWPGGIQPESYVIDDPKAKFQGDVQIWPRTESHV